MLYSCEKNGDHHRSFAAKAVFSVLETRWLYLLYGVSSVRDFARAIACDGIDCDEGDYRQAILWLEVRLTRTVVHVVTLSRYGSIFNFIQTVNISSL